MTVRRGDETREREIAERLRDMARRLTGWTVRGTETTDVPGLLLEAAAELAAARERVERAEVLLDFDAAQVEALAEELAAARQENAQLREKADLAVTATLPLLPLNGSWNTGYRVSGQIDPTSRALPEEWAEAAFAIAALHAALAVSSFGESEARQKNSDDAVTGNEPGEPSHAEFASHIVGCTFTTDDGWTCAEGCPRAASGLAGDDTT